MQTVYNVQSSSTAMVIVLSFSGNGIATLTLGDFRINDLLASGVNMNLKIHNPLSTVILPYVALDMLRPQSTY